MQLFRNFIHFGKLLRYRPSGQAMPSEAEEIKRTAAKHDISIQHFFDKFSHADLTDPTVRDYLLDYFVDKIFIYNDRVIVTIWYGDDKKELAWGDIDFKIKRPRKRRKNSSVSEGVPAAERLQHSPTTRERIFIFTAQKSIWSQHHSR